MRPHPLTPGWLAIHGFTLAPDGVGPHHFRRYFPAAGLALDVIDGNAGPRVLLVAVHAVPVELPGVVTALDLKPWAELLTAANRAASEKSPR